MTSKRTLTPRQIVILAKKYHLMPVLYDMDKMLSDNNFIYAKGVMDFFCRYNASEPVKDVIEFLRIQKRLKKLRKTVK